MDDWKPGGSWHAEPLFNRTLRQERTSESQQLLCMQGATVQWQADSAIVSGEVLGYEKPTVMFVRPDAASALALMAAGALAHGDRWAMVAESQVLRYPAHWIQ